jgi:hypothetical protein
MLSHARTALLVLLIGGGGLCAQSPWPPAHVGGEDNTADGRSPAAPLAPVAPLDAASGWAGPASGCRFGAGCEEPHAYGRLEYLLWTVRGDSLPPLVTTSPAGTPQANAGVLGGGNNSQVLFGDTRLDDNLQHGGRLTLGVENVGCGAVAIEADVFFLGGDSQHFDDRSGPSGIIARPFVNAKTGANSALLVAFPGLANGELKASTATDFMGAGFRILEPLVNCSDWRVNALGGYRFLQLREHLDIASGQTIVGASGFPAGTTMTSADRFETTDNFHGVDLGAVFSVDRGPFSVDLTTKLAMGFTHEFVAISGFTSAVAPGAAPLVSPGGLLAQPTNNPRKAANGRFDMVPEVDLQLSYAPTHRLRIFCGYNFLYWNRVARPGEEIDTTVNTSQLLSTPTGGQTGVLTGPPRPLFFLHDTGFWAQGISAGMEVSF